MKKITPFPFLVIAAIAAPSFCYAADVDDGIRSAYRKYAAPEAGVRAFLVPSGEGRIDTALGQIIPMPYRIMLDSSVAPSIMLHWSGGDNWMEVLTLAVSPLGLVVIPDWPNNTLTIAWRKRGQNPPPRFDSAVRPDPVAQITGGFSAYANSSVSTTGEISSSPAPLSVEGGEMGGVQITEKIKHGALPSGATLWTLMQDVVRGGSVEITGYSASPSEWGRVKWANIRAGLLKESLVKIGFPAERVLVKKRTAYPSPEGAYSLVALRTQIQKTKGIQSEQ